MNTLKKILNGACLLFSISLYAQNKESASDFPFVNKTEVSDQALEALFLSTGKVSIDLAPGFSLKGTILNKSQHGNSVASLLIRMENQSGGTLSISKYTDPNGHIFYTGRLLKLHDPEGMMLVEKDQHYYLVETQQRFLVAE